MPDYVLKIYNSETDYINNSGHSFSFNRAMTLSNNFTLNNIKTPEKCGGKAICGFCRIKVLSNQKYCSKPNDAEKSLLNKIEINEGWRLACQLYSLRDISIYLP